MIVVIADDFTGAAELAGISLRYGLKVKLVTGTPEQTDADVLVISTDSRSMGRQEALQVTGGVLKEVLKWNPSLLYKKIDSVLRGYVLEELELQKQMMKLDRIFIEPANPSLGRTIRKGVYYIQDRPVSETGFSGDPEFPVKSSLVKKMLGDETVTVLDDQEEFPREGFIIGEADSESAIADWASRIDESFILAGAGDFYTKLLDIRFKRKIPGKFPVQFPFLYVCGTAYNRSVSYVKELYINGGPVVYITRQIISKGTADKDWLEKIKNAILKNNKAVIAFDTELVDEACSATHLRTVMAAVVESVIRQNTIKELLIEGGSTATAILKVLGIHRLIPVNEWERGVVRMQSGSLFITVKPGSYELPADIKKIFGV